ncbi:nuclear transport factor 2 family protein [Microbulbifer spongiae]|uniref:Nuclear transport factor 2 family protein n=1 Tax=Microbulbifer spongiae TaxID=2944933 RepID=A0ABY9E7Z5_9GAMM|nr:nuclear transport factor 2 family protein [Microbulbifer sp. MI-G]WKD48580.1 nuclear transport factor 2 family protein [Microbulbifer sp. MI-G]
MCRVMIFALLAVFPFTISANATHDRERIHRAVLDYIESQHKVRPDMMKRSLDNKLAKRTYWQAKDGSEFIMETNFDTMLKVAEAYNKNGNKFPSSPRVDIQIMDIDRRVASVKLTVDEWMDYLHLYKDKNKKWKIINVLWQYHDAKKHKS